MKLFIITASIAVVTSSAAFADNQQMSNLLAIQRAQEGQPGRTTTVAVYSNDRGVGRSTVQPASPEARFELRANQHGQFYPAWVPAS